VPRPELAAAAWRAARPPLRDRRFWLVQALIALVFLLHQLDAGRLGLPAFTPIPHLAVEALFLLPVLYAAFHFGLSGALATAGWVTALMSFDIVVDLPGMGSADLWAHWVELGTLDIVALAVGWRVEIERLAHARALRASAERLAMERRYRHLFDANRSPILVIGGAGSVVDANPAARGLFSDGVVGCPVGSLLGQQGCPEDLNGKVLTLGDGRDYRVRLAELTEDGQGSRQVILEDITEERLAGARATRYARLVVSAEEDQRRRLSRELHDEPLQLFLHLARSLESIGEAAGMPPDVRASLSRARDQALAAAARLRSLARLLRPPALDQLGLVPALSGLLAEAEEDTAADCEAQLEVRGQEARLFPELELAAFRIVQEGVRNATRHAHARHLRVTVSFGPDDLNLRIADDGCGFDPADLASAPPGHLGLVGMRERAHLLGGELTVDSVPGAGTVVAARLPLLPADSTER
jgi:signal transduction histidine kinase